MAEQETFKHVQDTVSAALVETTRAASRLASEDLAFLRVTDPQTAQQLDHQSARLLDLARSLLRTGCDASKVRAPALADAEALDEEWTNIVDVTDKVLERADAFLDEFTGTIKRGPAADESAAPSPKASNAGSRIGPIAGLPRPQLKFKHAPRNDETTPFRPLLQSKPHAIVPLDQSLELITADDEAQGFKHPYEVEIEQYQFPQRIRKHSKPISPKPFGTTTAQFVDTIESFHQMLSELRGAGEIAVDLEHHDTFSYIGLVSLMQISTRDKDWIVDTLQPWREELQLLNEVFADPNVVKVLHGAYMDVVWLQRDLGIYVVGLFDTFCAALTLVYPGRSLAFLLSKFVQFEAQKKYQLADWRQRPLPSEMSEYARSDTHFLLYIFDQMRNELLDATQSSKDGRDCLSEVLNASKEVALRRYERPIYNAETGQGPNGWYNALSRTPALSDPQQFAVFRGVHQWRDSLARRQDENPEWVLSKSNLFNLAREMPCEMSQLLGLLSNVSTTLRSRLGELLNTIKRAKEQGKDGPAMREFFHDMEQFDSHAKRRTGRSAHGMTSSFGSVAQVLEQERFQASLPEQPPTSLKALQSSFWGETRSFVGEISSVKTTTISTERPQVRLTVPLPTASGAVDQTDATKLPSPESEIVAAAQPSAAELLARKKAEILTLRDRSASQKRRADDTNDGIQSQETDDAVEDGSMIAVTSNDASPPMSRAERRAARKTAKADQGSPQKANSNSDQPHTAEPESSSPSQPSSVFDYATAPTMLHGSSATTTGSSGARKRQRRAEANINPYAKLQDGPAGARARKSEGSGKSATFAR